MEAPTSIQEAVLVEAGIIRAVGTNKQILSLKDSQTKCIDLMGKTMLPGLIDAHSHFIGVANALAQCDLSGAENFSDIVRLMKNFITQNAIPAGQWVYGRQYDDNFLAEGRHPTKDLLNEISTDHPIMIAHASGHMGVVNDMALALMGLNDDVADPSGGHYQKDQNGHLTGYMEEKAFIAFQNAVPSLDFERLLQLMEKAQMIYASYGITTIQEGMVTAPMLQLLEAAGQRGILKLDVVAYLDLASGRQEAALHSPYWQRYTHHLKIGGYKMFLDGSPQARTAWLTEPYVDQDSCGYPAQTDEKVYAMIRTALTDQTQILAHCNGDAAAEQYLQQFTKVVYENHFTQTFRPVMIHAQMVREDQLAKMPALDMIPSFFIAHTYYWGDVHIRHLGWQRASRISPAKTALAYGLPLTFHQDSPVIAPNMMQTIACACRRVTKNGVVLGADECISVWDALLAVTLNGAHQYFEEAEKGTISVGKKADLVILDRDPLITEPQKLSDIEVLMTIKDGAIIYQKKGTKPL